MIKVGVTGSNGFVGYHLCQTLNLYKEAFSIINFDRSFFDDDLKLEDFVLKCDVIVHLAALNRHIEPEVIYETNKKLVNKLILVLIKTSSKAHLIISSSTQEDSDNSYGKSKKVGRLLLSEWANNYGGRLSGLIIPNVFGPFGNPNYNSVVATFCHQIANNETPIIDFDGNLKLIYVGDLVEIIIKLIYNCDNTHQLLIPHTKEAKVSAILSLLKYFKSTYQDDGEIPVIKSDFEFKLFNTFRCYINIYKFFPRKYSLNSDNRGTFVELVRNGIPGQTSFSTTLPGITRGNHFHTRKIERFSVIKGKALIQLRRKGTKDVFNFYLDGDDASYVDMPIWYTHNITNIGKELLYTIFWINEPFDSNDADTYFEIV
jgi:UDP-2-acetamido-2,6-beta-L-arabino-hexul-4-ose reductase